MLLLAAVLLAAVPAAQAGTGATEQQVKAVFVFNFSHFVAWPPESFATPADPFVIGVLGSEDFATLVEDTVRDERVEAHPLVVHRYRSVDEIDDCRILYIDRTRSGDLERALARVDARRTLTVSDLDGAARRGVMIQLANEDNRIRLSINAEAARGAGLTISSNLLRLARPARGN